MENNEININISNEYYRQDKLVADFMGITEEELAEKALRSFLYTGKDYITHIEKHVFPQIMVE